MVICFRGGYMYSIFTKPPNQIVVGAYLIGVTAVSYTGMRVVFFGVPHFADTGRGLIEMVYTAANLALIGIGAYSIFRGMRERRKGEAGKVPSHKGYVSG